MALNLLLSFNWQNKGKYKMFKYMIQEFNRDDRDYRRFFQSRNVSLSSFNKSRSLINERNISGKKDRINENSFFPMIAKKMLKV